ncbi:LytR/AlgR family response regulator transcription factor [Bacillus sp. SCS-153A]|uniref:LytR/AlgR family response regulator transcription factor n=1 Tax=Rossellomorea sedimentorum TaxID=3115294 RepID=UPI0039057A40
MNIVIADDDYAGRKILHHFLSALKEYTIIGEAENGEELIRHLIMEKPDIAIVDINMPFVSGMDAIKSCKESLPDLQVIFITGYREYAAEAFDWDAADYIVKPLMLPRLKQALERAKRLRKDNLAAKEDTGITMNANKKLIIKNYNNFLLIPYEDIIYIEKMERKTIIHTRSQTHETSETLAELMDRLTSNFIHSHRSYIININHIEAIRTSNQTYYAIFKEYKGRAKISKNHISGIQKALLNQR